MTNYDISIRLLVEATKLLLENEEEYFEYLLKNASDDPFEEILAVLATAKNAKIRAAVAANECTSRPTLARLAEDDDESVLRGVERHPWHLREDYEIVLPEDEYEYDDDE
jgi:hypothetical protein